jgi:tetratricopeptide (TPR) repeat protein
VDAGVVGGGHRADRESARSEQRRADGGSRASVTRSRRLAWGLGDLERAKERAQAAIPVAVETGSTWDELSVHTVLGLVANDEGDRALARRHHERSMALKEQLGLEPVVEKLNLGAVARDDGDVSGAQLMFEDVLAIHRRNENVRGIGTALLNLGAIHHRIGEHEASLRAFGEARECFEEVGFRAHVAHALQGVAAYAASDGRFEDAARLLGQARGELDESRAPAGNFPQDLVAETEEHAREALGDEAFEAAYAAGRVGPG